MSRRYLCANPAAMTPLPALAFGFMLGMRHATDADHVAAVSTLVAGGPSARRAALVGAWWGAGHSMSVLVVGGALVLLRTPMPPRVALVLEFGAALMLIALGMRSMFARASQSPGSSMRPFAVGVVHGLAGSALLALLVLGATSTALAATVYLTCFCLGTVGGMALVTALFALPARMAPAGMFRVERAVRVTAGVASVAIGLALAHRVGVRDGLFAATTAWTPE
jgi:high-affinity nickel-transport protein